MAGRIVFVGAFAQVLCGLVLLAAAHAGAWTQKQGEGQIIFSVTVSRAREAYNSASHASLPVSFNKVLAQTYIEYGLRDYLTLFAEPEYAIARSGPRGGPAEKANALAVGGGARLRLMDDHGVLSLQGAYKTAGAFDTSVSVNQESGRQYEVRLLYGTNFGLFNRTGFADVELGERWIAGARPNETPIDLTVGLHATKDLMVLLQSFNIVAGGDARPPYTYYRSHKLALSAVYRVYGNYSLQFGGFVSPAGQNALEEEGITIAIWDRF